MTESMGTSGARAGGIPSRREVDVDRLRLGNAGVAPVVLAIVLGLVLGAVIGGAYGASRPKTSRAETVISILPEDQVVSSEVTSSTDSQDATAFIQSELVVLNGRQLQEQVQTQLGLGSLPTISASQVGDTYVVDITATASTAVAALRIATTTASAYSAKRVASLQSDVTSALTAVQTQITSVRSSLAAAGPTTNVTTTESALQAEYERLLAASSEIQLSQGQLQRDVTVVQPSTTQSGGLSSTAKDGLLGAVLGAVLAILVLLGLRRATPRIRSVADVSGLGVRLLLPELPRRRRGRPGATTAARLLAGRVVDRAGPGAALLLVGATGGVGTSRAAAELAAAQAELGPVLVLAAADLVAGTSTDPGLGIPADAPTLAQIDAAGLNLAGLRPLIVPSRVPGVDVLLCGSEGPGGRSHLLQLIDAGLFATLARAGWSVIVDAPALSESSLGLELARRSGSVLLVVGISVSRQIEVVTAVEVLEASGAHVTGAVLTSPARRTRGRRFRPGSTAVLPTATASSRGAGVSAGTAGSAGTAAAGGTVSSPVYAVSPAPASGVSLVAVPTSAPATAAATVPTGPALSSADAPPADAPTVDAPSVDAPSVDAPPAAAPAGSAAEDAPAAAAPVPEVERRRAPRRSTARPRASTPGRPADTVPATPASTRPSGTVVRPARARASATPPGEDRGEG